MFQVQVAAVSSPRIACPKGTGSRLLRGILAIVFCSVSGSTYAQSTPPPHTGGKGHPHRSSSTSVTDPEAREAMFGETVEQLRIRNDPLLDFAFDLVAEIEAVELEEKRRKGATRLAPSRCRALPSPRRLRPEWHPSCEPRPCQGVRAAW